MIKDIWQGILDTSLIEGLAVLFGLLYLLGISRQKTWGWFCAMISTALYVYICLSAQIYLEAGLQGFYLVMAFYGYSKWRKKEKVDFHIKVWPLKIHLANIFISSLVAICLAQLFIAFTNQQSPYLDAFSTVFSLLATFMVAKKILENWLYWIIIDIILVFLYASRELFLTSLQYLIFSIIAAIAFVNWVVIYKKQRQDDGG